MSYNTKNKTFAITQENEKRIKELAFKLGKNQNWVINQALENMYVSNFIQMKKIKDTTIQ